MMVRINLLPGQKRKRKRSVQQNIILVLAVVLVVEVIACIAIGMHMSGEIDRYTNSLRQRRMHKAELEQALANFPVLQKKIEELEKREETLQKLTMLRVGPQHILSELSRLLTYPKNAVQMSEARKQGWSLSWDVENVYLTDIEDTGSDELVVRGIARSMDDVSEFWLRLRTSKFLRNVRLVEIKKDSQPKNSVPMQRFEFIAEANFFYQTKEAAAAQKKLEETAEQSEKDANENAKNNGEV